MSKIVRRVSLASLVLLLCAFGSGIVGGELYWYESQQIEKRMRADGLYVSHVYPDTNIWQIIGVVLFFVSVSIAIAALMLWKQETNESG